MESAKIDRVDAQIHGEIQPLAERIWVATVRVGI